MFAIPPRYMVALLVGFVGPGLERIGGGYHTSFVLQPTLVAGWRF